ncbi:hypothetical protein MRB53_002348 [Persea americana]|uniref:Uncharacterized protein n=1 Tax=Persea americana TaxID=3435 RepID=A0ACC2MV72_PERAE|nr:hypothetical protein MRB53_002348 [Persea americana]
MPLSQQIPPLPSPLPLSIARQDDRLGRRFDPSQPHLSPKRDEGVHLATAKRFLPLPSSLPLSTAKPDDPKGEDACDPLPAQSLPLTTARKAVSPAALLRLSLSPLRSVLAQPRLPSHN